MSGLHHLAYDLSGRTCIVTGANSGIGFEIARNLARMNARVVLACRSVARAERARASIVDDTRNDHVEVMRVDTSSQRSIREFVDDFLDAHDALHLLVNNAGVWPAKRELSVDDIEQTWATNVLGYTLMTSLLRDVLVRSAPARIVNVASTLARGLELDDVEFERRTFRSITAYAQSKQANRMWTWALARRLEGTRVTANAVHPGGVRTELARDHQRGITGILRTAFMRLVARSPEEGADTPTWVAVAPELERVSGRWFAGRREIRCGFRDVGEQEALWELCERMAPGEGEDQPEG